MRGRRTTRYRRGQRAARTAKRGVKVLAKRVRKLERSIETKVKVWTENVSAIPGGNLSTGFSGGTYLYAGNPKYLMVNALSKSDGVQHRVGDSVLWTRLRGKIACTFGAGVTDKALVHFALVRHKHPKGTPTTAGLILNDIYGTVQPNDWDIPNDLNHKGSWHQDYDFLWAKNMTFLPAQYDANVGTTGTNHIVWNVNLKLNVKTTYPKSNTGTIADIETNALYLIAWTMHTPSEPGIVVHFSGTLYFKDG